MRRVILCVGVLLLLAIGAGAYFYFREPPALAETPRFMDTGDQLPTAAEFEELARTDPVELLAVCLTRYQREVKHGITATLIKKERVKGDPRPPKEPADETIDLSVKGDVPGADGKRKAHVRMISRLTPPEGTPEQRAAVRADAERIRKEAASGKDFAALAKEHSQGPGAADGGDIGEVDRGQMQEEFEKAVFSLKPGQVSDVIETETGFHIIKVEQRAGEAHQPLAEVKDDIREKLYRENMEQRYDRWLKEDLRAQHHVEILL